MIEEKIKKYKEFQKKMHAYGLMLATCSTDKETIAPKDGNKYRNEMMNIIYGETFLLETNPEYISLVEDLSKEDLGEELNRDLYLAKKALEEVTKFSKQEAMEFNLAVSESADAWLEAKTNNDYSVFSSHLAKLIELSKQRAHKRNSEAVAYNLFLDDYEEGMNIEKYDEFFNLVKEELIPLIKEIDKKRDYIDDSFLYKYYPKEKQMQFNKELLKYINFDSSWGYLLETEHPFTCGLSKNDIRITTNYDEYNVASNIFSVIHEAGHGHFEHNVDEKYDCTNIRNISSGMHESQSRFLENYIGRKKSFWVNLYPKLQEIFPENLKDVSIDQFVKAINLSKCSLIRTDADELTYPVHILIRYELEKGIFDGSVDVSKLDEIWNRKYKEYLNVDVKNVRDGILQDMHWGSAYFGYFPTYALGSAIGAQLLNAMEKQMDVDKLLENNQFDVIMKYLKENVQHDGALHNYDYVLKRVSNESFNPRYYIDYLKNKYSKIYGLESTF